MDVCGESVLHIHINLSFTFCQEGGDKKEKDEKGKDWDSIGFLGSGTVCIMEKITVVWWEWKEFKGVV